MLKKVSKLYAKIYYPEIFESKYLFDDPYIAYMIFEKLIKRNKEIDEDFKRKFEEALKEGGEGWCHTFKCKAGEIAVFSDASLTAHCDIYIVEINKEMKREINQEIEKMEKERKEHIKRMIQSDDMKRLREYFAKKDKRDEKEEKENNVEIEMEC